MRILIIDNSKVFMDALRRYIAKCLPDVEVTAYDLEQKGRPTAAFDWSVYHLLFLSTDLAEGQSGFDLLREVGRAQGFPRTVMMTSGPDGLQEILALKVGARAVINKAGVNLEALAGVIRRVAGAEGGTGEMPRARDPQQGDAAALRYSLGASGALDQGRLDQGYRFVRLIGQGAITRVYLAERLQQNVTVVLKILDTAYASDKDMVRRFAREADLVSQLDSPYVVKVYEQGFTNSYGFIAMEFFSRGDLKQHLEAGVTPYDALLYALNIAYGLRAIHSLGIVHRDLKPANVMFRADGSLALADFGISKRLGMAGELTDTGDLLGTPHYMSPEQFLGTAVDERTDLYALGVILYEMLTGRRPFAGQSIAAIAHAHLRDEPPDLPPELACCQRPLNRLLAKEPDNRYLSADQAIAALKKTLPCIEAGAGGKPYNDEETVKLPQNPRRPSGR